MWGKYVADIQNRNILIHQSKANLYEKILFHKIANLYDPEIRHLSVRGLCGNQEFHVLRSGP